MNDNKKQLDQQTLLIIRLILVSLSAAIVPTLLVMSIGATTFLQLYLIEFIFTMTITSIGLQNYLKFKMRTKNEVKAMVKNEKIINGELILINNEEKLKNVLSLEIERIQALNKESAVIFFDVDDLGVINKKYGYDFGDMVLVELIKLTKTLITNKEQLARIKGDTFALILPNQSVKDAYKLAERLKTAVEKTSFGDVGRLTCRFAVVSISDIRSEDKILNIAYEKLILAKEYGKGVIV
ncbi:GGDEF domain-containing protein [Fusibacter ferrireducens]|uniref:GGDEF domain-containing protein n=1 Tax=Fusibacter ferrireducens TaxID=2785058 RepID=A0ABR9ZYG7_9FIRM|nr:GGDEF domain-containing protein [Fusibacter ferrireducens]MBF4695497.1 GGDEF domain-containing protein [Fusibacter ferrireducens]